MTPRVQVRQKPGPKEETVTIEGGWEDAVARAMAKKVRPGELPSRPVRATKKKAGKPGHRAGRKPGR